MNPEKAPQTNENTLTADNTASGTEERTLSLLQKIQSGALDPKLVRPTERRILVGFLMSDGYSAAEIAQILKVSDRSIERDKKAIREENAIAPNPKLVEQMVGRLMFEADLSIQRIRKATRDKDAPASVKIDAEHRCYQIVHDMVLSLQRLGFLPIATARLQADITHSIGQVPDFPQMQSEVQRLMQIAGEIQGTDPKLTEQLAEIKTQIVKVELASKIQTISAVIQEQEGQEHE
jgi:transposase